MAIKANDLRKGDKIDHNGDIWIVRDVQHRTPGNLRAFVQVRLQSLLNNRTKDERFGSTDTLNEAPLEARKMQYLYTEGDMLTFMDVENYDQIQIPGDTIGDAPKYLVENAEVMVQFLSGKPLGVDLPPNVILKIIETEPGVRGDTVNNVLKPAKCETGAVVGVPIFVNEGDNIKVDTRTGEYLGRA